MDILFAGRSTVIAGKAAISVLLHPSQGKCKYRAVICHRLDALMPLFWATQIYGGKGRTLLQVEKSLVETWGSRRRSTPRRLLKGPETCANSWRAQTAGSGH